MNAITMDRLGTVYRILQYYANRTTYQGERIGGVLEGCPRAPAPTTEELIREAQTGLRLLEAIAGGVEHVPLDTTPIDMVLHCPACGEQHIDATNLPLSRGRNGDGSAVIVYRDEWDNPPHRSHLCHHCGHIWRPADVCTNGVAAIRTHGKNDSQMPQTPGHNLPNGLWAYVPIRATKEMIVAASNTPGISAMDGYATESQLRNRSVARDSAVGTDWYDGPLAQAWDAMVRVALNQNMHTSSVTIVDGSPAVPLTFPKLDPDWVD